MSETVINLVANWLPLAVIFVLWFFIFRSGGNVKQMNEEIIQLNRELMVIERERLELEKTSLATLISIKSSLENGKA
jgi:hypothetical protein